MVTKRARNGRKLSLAVGFAAALLAVIGAPMAMAGTDTRFPASNAAVTVPTAVYPLADPENAYADDGVYATGNLDAKVIGGVPTGGGFAHDFGDFGFDAIPVDATITSVTAEMKYKFAASDAGSVEYDVIVFTGGSLLSSAHGTADPTVDTVLATAPFTATRDQLLDGALVVEVAATSSGAGTTTQSMLVDYVSVTVAYTVPAPTITVPSDVTLTATSTAGAVATFVVTATDDQDGALTPTCAPPSGSLFPVGTTTVTCTATDGDQNTATASFTVTVESAATPAPTSSAISPALTPPPTSTAGPPVDDQLPAGLPFMLPAGVGLVAFVIVLAQIRGRRTRGR